MKKNGNINKEMENLKRNQYSGAEMYNNWNERLTIGTQKQIWAGGKKNQQTQNRIMEITEPEEHKEKDWRKVNRT